MIQALNKRRKLGNKGFSLVELIIVIAIMAVLVAILAPQYIKYVEKSKLATDDNFMGELKHNVEIAMSDPTIYNLITDNDRVTWTCTAGTIVAVHADASAFGQLQTALDTVMGAAGHPCASKGYQGDTYVLTFDVGAGGVTVAATTTPTP